MVLLDESKITNGASLGIPALAYLGDAVFELQVRVKLLNDGICSAAELNRLSLSYVTAQSQSDAAKKLLPFLTESELASFNRGKNHKNNYHPKSVDIVTYRRATGLETLFACLYLNGNTERIKELFELGFVNNEQL